MKKKESCLTKNNRKNRVCSLFRFKQRIKFLKQNKYTSFGFKHTEHTVIHTTDTLTLSHFCYTKHLNHCSLVFIPQVISLNSVFSHLQKYKFFVSVSSFKNDSSPVLKRSHSTLPLCVYICFFCSKYCFKKYILVFFSDSFIDKISNGSNFSFFLLGFTKLHLHPPFKSKYKWGFSWSLLTPVLPKILPHEECMHSLNTLC